MEYCPKGDLHHCIEQQRLTGSLFPQEQVLAWATQLLLALDYLHQGKVLHRDLKSQNVFISRRNHLKLGDFGVSLCLESTDQFAHTLVGT
jgi:NIMA (never in mitosis gene a)-related kinase